MTHPWPMFAPEANYYSMVLGAGPAPMLAYGDVLLAHNASMTAVVGVSTATAVGTAAAFVGNAGSASEAALVEHNTQHSVFADEALARAQIAHLAAATHSATVTQMVPAPPAHANRLEEAADELINPIVWGALTPRIADLNLEYFGFMWPNNAAAGVRYGAALDGLGAALMTPSLPAISGGSAAAVAVAAATVAESAALSGMQAAVGAVGTGISAVASPAAALPAAALSAVTSSASSVSSAPVSSTPPVQPMATVQHAPSVPAQPLAPAQSSAGMFAPPPTAAVMPPAVPNPAAESPAAQLLTPRPAPVAPPMPAAPGVTSFVPPAQPFSPPPPTAGRAAGLGPGMLNASALRGPVSTMPLTTTATSTLATATQPLAYVPPEPPRPPVPPTPPQPPLLNPGDTAHTLNPPPQPQQSPPPHHAPQPSAPQEGQAGPSTGSGGPEGSGGPGTQMPGSAPSQAPQAPPAAIPLDTRPPVPPPPEPGEPAPRAPTPPSWASPPVPKSVQAAKDELDSLEKLIQHHNSNPPSPSNLPAVADYNAEADYYNAWAAQLQGQLGSSNTEYTPATPAKTAETPSWTQPAPQQPVHQGPGSQPQPGAPSSPNLAEQAKQIGREVSDLPKGTRSDAIADKVTGLHLNQEQAAEAADIAAQAAFGDTSGIASLPDGTKVVLPLRIDQGIALIVHSDGSVTVFRGDLYQFLPFLGR